VPSEIEELREGLLAAYAIIRQQTEQICDLHILIVPLIKALDDDEVSLGEAYLRQQGLDGDELIQSKTESLAVVDQAIRRLRKQ
jgi:hypothetical protein